MDRRSGLYVGVVTHARRTPVVHRFERPTYLHYLDLDELDELRLGPLFSTRRPAPVRFCARDYLDGTDRPLAPRFRELAAQRLGDAPTGPVRLLATVRTWGWCFNPITLAFLFDGEDRQVEAIVASVTNTPWHERAHYVLDARGGLGSIPLAPKRLHVSPFAEMDLAYRFRISEPGERLDVVIDAMRGDERVLSAAMRLHRRTLSAGTTAQLLLRQPLHAHRVSAGIRLEALRLWRKGAPVHPHPVP